VDDIKGPFQGKTLEARTLGVPVGWNKPADQLKRLTCREVEITCGRGAASLESRSSRFNGYGAEMEKTLGAIGFPARCERV